MNARDNRVLIGLLCGGLLLGAYLLVYNLYWVPLSETDALIAKFAESNLEKKAQVDNILRDKEKLRQWRALSLPGVENLPPPPPRVPRNPQQERDHALYLAKDHYLTYLRGLLRRHTPVHDDPRERAGEASRNLPQVAPNLPVYTPLVYGIQASGKLEQIVALLAEFETAPLLQRVRKLTIKRTTGTSAGKAPKEPLTVSMTVEALIVNGAAKRGDSLFTTGLGPTAVDATMQMLGKLPGGLSALPWHELYARAVSPKGRDYKDIARKNIFESGKPAGAGTKPPPTTPPPVDPPRPIPDLLTQAYLMDVTVLDEPEALPRATVYDRATDKSNRLRTAHGWNWIPLLKDADMSTVIRGRVVRIGTAGLVFRVEFFAQNPAEESVKSRFTKDDVIYQLYKTDVETLVKAKVIKATEVSRTYKVPLPYWESLVYDKVVRVRWDEFTFKHGLVRGKILKSDPKRDGPFVLIRLHEKYCTFEGGEVEVRPHAGYCFLKIGEKLVQALQTPLRDSEVKELTRVAVAP